MKNLSAVVASMAAAIALLLACAGIAGTVSLSRIFGFRHFASDAFVGAVMGWYIGALIQRRHRCFASANFQATL